MTMMMTIVTPTEAEVHAAFGDLLRETLGTLWLVHDPEDPYGGPTAFSQEILLGLHAEEGTEIALAAPCIVRGADVFMPTGDGLRLAMTRLVPAREVQGDD